jgi:hypothetical protein
VTLSGSFITVAGARSQPAITRGAGEGDCAVDTFVEPAKTETDGLMIGLPSELLGKTPPAGPVTSTQGSWTLTFTTK